MHRLKITKWLSPLLLFLLLVCTIVMGGLYRTKTWDHIDASRLVFSEGAERQGDPYGILNEGPGLTLPGGKLSLSWEIETDAENRIRIETTNNAAVYPSEIVLQPGVNHGSAEILSLDEIYNLQILVDYQAGSFIRVNRIDLTSGRHTDAFITLSLFLAAALILSLLQAKGRLTPALRGSLLLITAAVLIASIPDLRENLHTGHDGEFHMGRLLNLVHGLRSGQFPVRLGAYMQNGYGAIMSVYYPELLLYIPALLMLCGASFAYSYHVFFILMHLASALLMYVSARRMFKSEASGVAASVLYTLSLYRLMDIYERFAIGESLALCFLPLFFWALYDILIGDGKTWKTLALSAALICQSHLLTTAICGIAAVCLTALCCVRVIREKRFIPLLKAAAAAAALNLFFFLPLYTYSHQNIATSWMMRDLSSEALAPAQLFFSSSRIALAHDAALKACPVSIGFPLLLLAVAAAYIALTKEQRDRDDRLALFLCLSGAVFAVMSTKLFPWGTVVSLTGGLASYIQFPWRLLTLTTLCFSLAGGYAVSRLPSGQKTLALLAVLGLCGACMLPFLSETTNKENFVPSNRLPYWDQRFGDYTLPGANLRALDVTQPLPDEGIQISGFTKFGTEIEADVLCQADGSILFPLYAFDGYTARLNGEPLPVSAGEYSHLLVSFTAGMSGRLQISFEGKAIWRVGDLLSLIAWVLFIALCLIPKKERKRS